MIDPQVLNHWVKEAVSAKEKKSDKKADELNHPHSSNKRNVIVLTSLSKDEKGDTAKKIKEICRSKDIDCYVVGVESAYLEKREDGTIWIHNAKDEKGFEIDKDRTIAFVRRSVVKNSYTMNLLSRLERYKIFCLNKREAVEICEDKYRTCLRLAEAGIQIPKTSLIPNEEAIDRALESVGGKFPLVVKTLSGTQGVGVFIVDSYASMKSILQTMWKIGNDTEILIQQYIEADFDIRCHILGDEFLAAMKRLRVENDFRTNVHLGGQTEKVKLTKEQIEICIKAAKAVGAQWAGVDFMIDKKGNAFVLEVNASPGTDGIEEISGVPVTEKVIEYALDDANWRHPTIECGLIEILEVDGLGKVKCKMDVGNTAKSCSIDAEFFSGIELSNERGFENKPKWEQDGKPGPMLKWKFKGKEYEHQCVGTVAIKSNNATGIIERRPVILMDVTFDGAKYTNVPFNLNKRSHKNCPMLANVGFMQRAGLVINPTQHYLLSVDTIDDEVE